ncbi:MAG: hypothetical protein ACTHMC_05255 [Pseudobacter sp.]|uniref:hypothetical protein n=1 Tax=Pseudobacter sp. TaxID=2045420 RepID=UPI003F80A5BD
MNLDIINKKFREVVSQPGIYNQLKVSKNVVAQYRWKLKRGVHISIDKQLSVIHAAGVRLDIYEYRDQDLVAAIEFALRSSQAARGMGAAYLLEKWKAGNMQ